MTPRKRDFESADLKVVYGLAFAGKDFATLLNTGGEAQESSSATEFVENARHSTAGLINPDGLMCLFASGHHGPAVDTLER